MRLSDRIAERETQRFVGRDGELAVLNGLFADDPPYSVVHVHGPGGIGKSALLRQAAAEGERCGWTAYWVEGRDLLPTPGGADALRWSRRSPTRGRSCCSTRSS